MEQTISEQGADISQLHCVINQKGREIHILKKRLSKYEEPDKDSHNSCIPPSQESIPAKAVRRTHSLRKKSERKTGGQLGRVSSLTFPNYPAFLRVLLHSVVRETYYKSLAVPILKIVKRTATLF